jgi:hypothetical protein
VLTGFVEPVLFLLAFGFGIGQLISSVEVDNVPVSYAAFIAPALLASSAMNGAIFDSTYNVYFKMHYSKVYQGMLATSLGPLDVALGEIGWAVLRGGAYAMGFMAIAAGFGLVPTFGSTGDPRGTPDRLCLLVDRHVDHLLHVQLPPVELAHLLAAADVPVLRDVLSGEQLPEVTRPAVHRGGGHAACARSVDGALDIAGKTSASACWAMWPTSSRSP